MTGQTVLLVGGSGFIGQALAHRLARQGRRVHILSRSAPPRLPEGVAWHPADGEIRDLLGQCGLVIYLAATSTPGRYRHQPAREAEENLLPLLAFLHVLSEHPRLPLIYFSTGGALYGNPGSLPVGESAPLAPLSNYAAGKAAAEMYLGVHAHQGRPVTILRPANVYGPGQPYKPGFGVIRAMLEHVRHGTRMEIWGDGKAVRDYLFIDDLLDACERLAEQPESGGIYNLGSGIGHSLNEVIPMVERVTGRPLQVHYRAMSSMDVAAIVLDAGAFASRYEWCPDTPLEQGIAATWAWLLAQT